MGRRKSRREKVERRRLEKKLRALRERREELAALELGASPARPLRVSSAALVEARARTQKCIHCEGELQLCEHAARFIDRQAFRRLELRCKLCHATRILWLVVQSDLPT